MLLDHLPQALRLLRESRNLTQDAAATQIRKNTGVKVTAARISQWERGEEKPSMASFLAFVEGLDRTLHDFARAVDQVAEGIPPAARAAIAELEQRAENDPDFRALIEGLEKRVRTLEGKTGDD